MIKHYLTGHICMFLRRITERLINYLKYVFIKIPVIKITYKTQRKSYSLLNKTNVCVYSVNITYKHAWTAKRQGVVRAKAEIISATAITTIQGETKQTQDVDPMID